MMILIETDSTIPLAEQIATQVRLGVARGDLAQGERLPSARDLATSLGVNMHTVLRAYDSLRESGIIELRRGRGATVVGGDLPAIRALVESARSLVRDALELGISPSELSAMVRGLA